MTQSEELHPSTHWEAEFGVHVMDPDGWRGEDGRLFTDPISKQEFVDRMARSTVAPVPPWECVDPTAEGLARAMHHAMVQQVADRPDVWIGKWHQLADVDRQAAINVVQLMLDNGVITPGRSCRVVMTTQSFREELASDHWGNVRAYNVFCRDFNDVNDLFSAEVTQIIDARNAGVYTWAVWTVAFEQFGLRPPWADELTRHDGYSIGYINAVARHREKRNVTKAVFEAMRKNALKGS